MFEQRSWRYWFLFSNLMEDLGKIWNLRHWKGEERAWLVFDLILTWNLQCSPLTLFHNEYTEVYRSILVFIWTAIIRKISYKWKVTNQEIALERWWKISKLRRTVYNFNFVRLQWRLLALYLILLPVRILIHWGIGRFCFSFFASLSLILKVLCDDISMS